MLTNYTDGYNPIMCDHMNWMHGTPLAKEIDPLNAFNRVFAGIDPTATAQAIAKRQAYGQSVIDTVRAQATRLQTRLGKADQAKLDEYLTGVRELETRIQTAPNQSCNPGSAPAPTTDMPTLVKNMLDITVMAVQCDITRVVTFAYEYTVTEISHPFIDVAPGYHRRRHTLRLPNLSRYQLWHRLRDALHPSEPMENHCRSGTRTSLASSRASKRARGRCSTTPSCTSPANTATGPFTIRRIKCRSLLEAAAARSRRVASSTVREPRTARSCSP